MGPVTRPKHQVRRYGTSPVKLNTEAIWPQDRPPLNDDYPSAFKESRLLTRLLLAKSMLLTQASPRPSRPPDYPRRVANRGRQLISEGAG